VRNCRESATILIVMSETGAETSAAEQAAGSLGHHAGEIDDFDATVVEYPIDRGVATTAAVYIGEPG
jgi:hypothetical protein